MKTKNIFIVGCPQTGKTLLSQILNKYEKICIAEETRFLRQLSGIGRHKQMKKIGDMSNNSNVDQLIDYMYSSIRAPYWTWLKRNIDKQAFKQRLLETERSEWAIFLLLMQIYAEQTKGPIPNDIILGEETPTHLYYVPTLMKWFPQAKIIHLFRDPRALTVSRIKDAKRHHGGLRAKYPSLPSWLHDPSITPVEVLHMTKFWFDAIHLHNRYKQLYSQRYHFLRFEDMVSEPEKRIKQVCKFLNTPFEDKMLKNTVLADPSFKRVVNCWKENINTLMKVWFSIFYRKYIR